MYTFFTSPFLAFCCNARRTLGEFTETQITREAGKLAVNRSFPGKEMTSRTKSNKANMEKGLKPWLKKVPFATWFENWCFPAGRRHKHGRRYGSYLALSCRSSRPQSSKGHGNFCRNFIDCNPPKEPKGQKDTRISMIFAGCCFFKWSICVHVWSFWCHAVGASQTAGLGQPCHSSEFAARHPRPGELQLRAAAESCFKLGQRPPSEGWQLMSVVNCDISTEFRSKNYQRWRIARIHIVYKFQGKCAQRGLWAFLKTSTASPMWLQCREETLENSKSRKARRPNELSNKAGLAGNKVMFMGI